MFMCLWTSSHWVSLSNIYIDIEKQNEFNFYDSLMNPYYLFSFVNFFDLLCDMIGSDHLIINYIHVSSQLGANDCGLFSLAYCYDLCQNSQHHLLAKDPSQLSYDQYRHPSSNINNMRAHFNKCISAGYITAFPSIQNIDPDYALLTRNHIMFDLPKTVYFYKINSKKLVETCR